MALVQIQPETDADHAAIREVILAAFAHHREVADLVDAIRRSPHYEPELSLLARVDGAAAGFVMISHATLVYDDLATHDVLTLSPLGVAPEHQRQGVGSALVRTALAAADRTGAALVTLEGSPAYYGRLGFRYAPDLGVHIRLPDWAPAEAAQVYPLTGYRPDVRGRLDYPPAFDLVS
jgi:putative acetyltransferase